MAVAAIIVAVIAGQAGPAVSQSNTPYELREGLWVGESIAWAELGGSVQGTSATFDGVITTKFTMFVDENSAVDGDWILEGDAVMLMTGTVNGNIIFDYSGDGILTGDQQTINMNGDIVTQGEMSISGVSLTNTNTQPFGIPIQLTNADCYALDGDWIFPLDTLAEDAEWTSRNIDGWFYAAYFGDTPDDEILAEVDQLYADERAWSDAATESGQIDLGGLVDLVVRAQDLANRLAEADECLYLQTLPPDQFTTLFTIVLTSGLLNVVTFSELDGANVQAAAMALNLIGGSGLREPTSQAIQDQAQTIISLNMSSVDDACAPCMASDETSEVIGAALGGRELGQTFDVEGISYSPDRIIQVASEAENVTAP